MGLSGEICGRLPSIRVSERLSEGSYFARSSQPSVDGILSKMVPPSMPSVIRLLCLPIIVMTSVSCLWSVGNVGSPHDLRNEPQNVEREKLRELLEFIHEEQNSEHSPCPP